MTKRSSNNSILVITGGSILGIVALLGVLYSGAFGSFGNVQQLPQGTEICDVTGTLSGTTHDAETIFLSYVDNLAMNTGVTNCHPKGIAEFNLIPSASIGSSLPQGAVFVPGHVDIYMTITNKATGQLWGSHTFTVSTGIFEVNKDFVEPFTFAKLAHGQYHISVKDSWKDNGQTEILDGGKGRDITV